MRLRYVCFHSIIPEWAKLKEFSSLHNHLVQNYFPNNKLIALGPSVETPGDLLILAEEASGESSLVTLKKKLKKVRMACKCTLKCKNFFFIFNICIVI